MALPNSSEDAGSGATLGLPRALWIGMLVYFCAMTALGIDRYVTYHSGVDLGLFVQAIADGIGGMHNQIEGNHYLYHFSPLIVIATPLLLLTHSPMILIAIQALAGALVAPAIFLLARSRSSERLAILLAIVAFVYPPLVGVIFTDFHENGLAPAAIAWLLWAVDARRFGWAALFGAIALGIKEDEAFILTVLAAGYSAWSFYHKDKTAGVFSAALSLASALVFIAFFTVVRPAAGATSPWPPLGFYRPHSGNPIGLAGLWPRVSFLIEAFGPLLFLPLRSRWILLALPGFVEVLASSWPIAYTMGQHYAGVWVAYVLAAFVMALATIAQSKATQAMTLAKACIVVCVLVLFVASPTHWGHFLGRKTVHERALDHILAQVPARASVGAVDEEFVHLSLDPNSRPGFDGKLEYLVVDQDYDSPTWRAVYQPQLDRKLYSGLYVPIASEHGVTLYRLRQSS